jgi:hypothetical protein
MYDILFVMIVIVTICAQTSYSEQKWIKIKDSASEKFDLSRAIINMQTKDVNDSTIVNGCPIGFTGDNCDTGKSWKNSRILNK